MVKIWTKYVLLTTGLLLGLVSCTTVHIQQRPPSIDIDASWVLLPIVNHTQTPQAGLRAEAIVETIVRSRGALNLKKYPSALNSESLFEPAARNAVDKAMQWAQNLEADYALTGTVDEWRYKVGVDGEPAVGISLQLIEIRNGRVLWSAVGSKTGWSREALSAVAQKLLMQLTQPLATGSRPAKATKSASSAVQRNVMTAPVRSTSTAKSQSASDKKMKMPGKSISRVRLAPSSKASTKLADEQPQSPTRTKLPFPYRTPEAIRSGG